MRRTHGVRVASLLEDSDKARDPEDAPSVPGPGARGVRSVPAWPAVNLKTTATARQPSHWDKWGEGGVPPAWRTPCLWTLTDST